MSSTAAPSASRIQWLALRLVLEQRGQDIREVPAYQNILKLSFAEDEGGEQPVKKG